MYRVVVFFETLKNLFEESTNYTQNRLHLTLFTISRFPLKYMCRLDEGHLAEQILTDGFRRRLHWESDRAKRIANDLNVPKITDRCCRRIIIIIIDK